MARFAMNATNWPTAHLPALLNFLGLAIGMNSAEVCALHSFWHGSAMQTFPQISQVEQCTETVLEQEQQHYRTWSIMRASSYVLFRVLGIPCFAWVYCLSTCLSVRLLGLFH